MSALIKGLHMGRSWSGHGIEDECPCPQAACGLVEEPVDGCPHHDPAAMRTMRQGHYADACPSRCAVPLAGDRRSLCGLPLPCPEHTP